MSEPVMVGLDVAKATVDVAVRPSGECWSLPNTDARAAEIPPGPLELRSFPPPFHRPFGYSFGHEPGQRHRPSGDAGQDSDEPLQRYCRRPSLPRAPAPFVGADRGRDQTRGQTTRDCCPRDGKDSRDQHLHRETVRPDEGGCWHETRKSATRSQDREDTGNEATTRSEERSTGPSETRAGTPACDRCRLTAL